MIDQQNYLFGKIIDHIENWKLNNLYYNYGTKNIGMQDTACSR